MLFAAADLDLSAYADVIEHTSYCIHQTVFPYLVLSHASTAHLTVYKRERCMDP